MDITPQIAVEHIRNSLDNEFGSWYDREGHVTWHIDGQDENLSITLIDDEGNEVVYEFKLVKQ